MTGRYDTEGSYPEPRGVGRFLRLAVIFIFGSLLMAMIAQADMTEAERSTETKPDGYLDMTDVMGLFPDIVVQNDTTYDILDTLILSASQPLYLGPGSSLQFMPDTYLGLSAPPIFSGTEEEPIILSTFPEGALWTGVVISEADPLTTPVLSNISISNATTGLRTVGSDLVLIDSTFTDCSRSGVETQGNIPEGNRIVIRNTDLIRCESYGINLQKIGDSYLKDITTKGCGIGIKTYLSNLQIENVEVIDPGSMGGYFVESFGTISDSVFGSLDENSTVPSYQITMTKSDMSIIDTTMYNSMTGISILSESNVEISSSTIRMSITDCLQGSKSTIILDDVHISEATESGIHIEDCILDMTDTVLMDNGKGSANTVYSSIFMRNSDLIGKGGSIIASSDAHGHLVNSTMTLKEVDLDNYGNFPFILDGGSSTEIINSRLPSDVRFLDPFSTARASILDGIEVVEFDTGDPVDMVQVEIFNRLDEMVGSGQTDDSGITSEIHIPLYVNSSTGTLSMFPITITAVKDGYEISQVSLNDISDELMVILYPPNSPPDLNIITPTNGTEVTDSIQISGYLEDDLGVTKLRYRIGSGSFHDTTELTTAANGYFEITLEIGSLSQGEHRLWIYGFDGSHLSSPAERRIISKNVGLEDSDSDGIPDILEDVNGNGVVDENETDPNNDDTDQDGILDGIEVDDSDGNTTDPLDPDSDDDFLTDGMEDRNGNGRVDENETDPNKDDTDGDGYSDLDDRYPLDDERWKEISSGNDDATTTLILIVIVFILIAIVGYSLYQRMGGIKREENDSPDRRSADSGPRRRR